MKSRSIKTKVVILATGLFVAVTPFLGGCAKEAASESVFNGIYNASFSVTCVNCHHPGGSAYVSGTILDMSTADTAYNDLLNRAVQSVANPSQCMNVRRVAPGSPGSSYLLGVLSNSYNQNNFAGVSGCRPNTAHLSNSNLTMAEISAIANWISSGATR